ncbi:hypothetical protein N0V90_008133 [Kalmusia sp. IMI 367209]|nr:hypothetical protein N0V90_008133 [Kalmusia sp. IMI 367209]
MFSPEASIASARSSLRNPRRRPRNSDGPQQQQPRRKRSKLGDETFVPVGEDIPNGNGNGSITMNGHVGHGSVDSSLVLVDMPVREKKGATKRVFKENIALYLNKNENYSVKKLPSFPAALAGGSTPFRASALPIAGLALAVTTDQALVWDYTAATGASKVLTLPLPPALKGTEPLPLGEIVRNGPTNDYGVVVVAPSTGRIVFWENVDSAEARSHFPQRKQGIEGFVKLYSGERITSLVDVDHAGYILILSSGRLAQLTLRDAQGRPNIATTVLNTPNGSSGSFFSFKGLLGGAIRKTIASVKARPSDSKGQMEVIAATRNGLFQLWDLSWSGQQIFKREIDSREDILAIVQQGSPPEMRGQQDIHVLDFAIMGQPQDSGATSVLALVALFGRNMLDHFLLEVDLTERAATVSRAIPLRNYNPAELPKEASGTLLLPSPGHTALVQFPDAIVVASLAQHEESPDAQLFSDSGSALLPFQDSIYFKTGAHVRPVGHALEQTGRKNNTCSALVFIQDYGILQINAYPPPKTEEQDGHTKVTAFSKLVQVTFFSTVPGTILDFSTKERYSFSLTEVEDAALDISAGVLSSSFEHLEGNSIILEEQLRKRAFALQTLNSHVRSEYKPLSYLGRWQLLWHAEKLAASLQLWRWYQTKLREQELHPEVYPEKNIMVDIIKALHEKYKTLVDATRGETDPIRQFFLKDINSLEILLPWTWNYFRVFYIGPESTKSLQSIMQRLSEANDVLLIALETGYSFRQENVERYGLDPHSLKDGILKPSHGYDLLPQFWTSTHNITNSVRSVVDAGRKYADDCYEKHEEEDVAQKVAQDNPRLVRMSCQTHIERFQWALEQSDEKKRQMGKSLRDEWNDNVRPKQIYHLAGIGLATEGMNLAEQYQDMHTLVDLIWEETHYLEENLPETVSKMEQAEINVKLKRIQDRVERYFEQYGDDWAEAYFSKHIAENKSGLMLNNASQYQRSLTRYLRADVSRSRLRWINEVRGEKNYDAATHALYIAATKQETKAWNSKVELSMAKLALMAHAEGEAASPDPEPTDEREHVKILKANNTRNAVAKDINGRLELAKIQDQLYERLLPTITPALDDESAVQLLLAEYGQGRLTERPALQSLLKQGLDELVHHRVVDPCLLIDVLTLMTCEDVEDGMSVNAWNQFALALKVLAVYWSNFHRNVRQGLVGLIWKRLLLQDNWVDINSNQNISDQTLSDYLGHTTAGWTLKILCGWISDDKDAFGRVGPPRVEQMYGAGCTDGELCTRFASEDLRQPIIRENLVDEAMVKDLADNHRLEDWLEAACKAGSLLHRSEQERDARDEGNDAMVGDVGVLLADAEPIADSVEPGVGEAFKDGDDQGLVDDDVEMQGL